MGETKGEREQMGGGGNGEGAQGVTSTERGSGGSYALRPSFLIPVTPGTFPSFRSSPRPLQSPRFACPPPPPYISSVLRCLLFCFARLASVKKGRQIVALFGRHFAIRVSRGIGFTFSCPERLRGCPPCLNRQQIPGDSAFWALVVCSELTLVVPHPWRFIFFASALGAGQPKLLAWFLALILVFAVLIVPSVIPPLAIPHLLHFDLPRMFGFVSRRKQAPHGKG